MIKNTTNAFKGGYESPDAKVLSLMGQTAMMLNASGNTIETAQLDVWEDEL